jgi:hypothetical protein
MSCHRLLTSFPALEKREKDRERDIETGANFWGVESIASPSLSTYGRAGWTPSKVTQAHLNDLMSQGS